MDCPVQSRTWRLNSGSFSSFPLSVCLPYVSGKHTCAHSHWATIFYAEFPQKIKAVYLILLHIWCLASFRTLALKSLDSMCHVLSTMHIVLVLKTSFLSTLIIDILLLKQKFWQSAGTDSAVNLWLASLPSSDEPTSERSFP